MKRSLLTALLIACGLVAGCDVCQAAAEVHTQRCAEGNADSCAWMMEHVEPTTGQVCG